MSARALLASFAVFLAMPSIIAASDEKNKTPEKTSEEVILERIDQLQSQLNELRAALAAQRTVNAPFSAPASASSAVSEAVATAADQQTPREPKSGLRPSAEPEKREPAEPFAFADFTWLTGNPRTKESPLETKAFTGEFRADVDFVQDLNHPQDHSIGGSSEVFRANEVQVTQLGIGGDFHYNNVRGRLMTQFGMYSSTTPRNDASPARGQWDLDTAYRYVSEAYGGYHINKLNGINIDAGIFMSYVGLDSYYQFDNWVYQPSYVSSNTPWFFNGVRIQIFPARN
jgi:hypothetical protein